MKSSSVHREKEVTIDLSRLRTFTSSSYEFDAYLLDNDLPRRLRSQRNYLDFSPPKWDTDLDQTKASEIEITSDGLISEKWIKIENVPSSVVSVDDHSVVLECLLDFELKHFEKRVFDSSIIPSALRVVGSKMLLKIFSRPGEIRFTFTEATNLFNKDYFESPETDKILESLRSSSPRLTKRITYK